MDDIIKQAMDRGAEKAEAELKQKLHEALMKRKGVTPATVGWKEHSLSGASK